MQHRVCLYCDAWGTFGIQAKDAYRQYYFLCGDHYSNEKTEKNKSIDVFALMVKHMNEKTPIKPNSGRGVVTDSTVSRIQDIYKGIRKRMNEIKDIRPLFRYRGFSLGLESTGHFETAAFCEIEPYCKKVLKKHCTDVPIFDDIRKLKGKDIGAIDIITGGYPCQPFSVAGKQKAKARSETPLARVF
ncbi:MAG: hypothetical protein CM15mV95_480 [Caudoviricetes sp.]|nr:MAG: hypothetical protein CM15mV95_480 [Caudoviricetes sp.]